MVRSAVKWSGVQCNGQECSEMVRSVVNWSGVL